MDLVAVSEPGEGLVVTVHRADILSSVAHVLISALNAELSERYPEEGAFLVACVAGTPVGCGAVRRIDEHVAEIKRMYVMPAARGHGVARAMLSALEAEARRLGANRLVLETGTRQPEALGLYERAGFSATPPFEEYVGSPLSVCMAKDL